MSFIYNDILRLIRSNIMCEKTFFIIICFCIIFLTIITLDVFLENFLYMSGRGYSLADILNPSSPGGSPQPPNNQPDHSTMGIIASNSNNNQENTPILTDTGNNPNNTSVETPPPSGLSGELVYTTKNGNNYIRIRGDVDGNQIAQLKRGALAFCELDTIRMPGITGPVHVLNLTECTSLEPFAQGKREGVWIPDVLTPSDSLKNHSGGYLSRLNGKVLVTRQTFSSVRRKP